MKKILIHGLGRGDARFIFQRNIDEIILFILCVSWCKIQWQNVIDETKKVWVGMGIGEVAVRHHPSFCPLSLPAQFTYHFSPSNPALGGWQAFESHHPEGYPFVAVQLRILQQQRNTFLKISFIWTH